MPKVFNAVVGTILYLALLFSVVVAGWMALSGAIEAQAQEEKGDNAQAQEEKGDNQDISDGEMSGECGWVSVNCCPANAGAQWECVNTAQFDLACDPEENQVCPQVMSPKPEESCRYSNGECVRASMASEEGDESEESEDKESTPKEKGDEHIEQIKAQANKLFNGEVESILEDIGEEVGEKVPGEAQEGIKTGQEKVEQARQRARQHLGEVEEKMENMDEQAREAIDVFVGYGADKNTKGLGAGERAAVVHSFNKAFNKLPETEEEVEDMVKIANGRWPGNRSKEAEERAKEKFREIYERDPDLDRPGDEAAVTVMAYGLRQRAENRNLESEERGIRIFKDIFGHVPGDAEDWNVMQAITYSGASK